MSVVEVDSLSKSFGAQTALRGISTSVDAGEVYGFLGPNGAGKSTAINVVLDFIKPTSGTVRVFGLDPAEEGVAVRRRTGTLLEGYGVYPRLTGREHLEHARDVKEVAADVDPLLRRVGLRDAADRAAGGYSKGMKQRLALAMAVLGDPELLILDEPTTGLDPNGARLVRELVEEHADAGGTVFFSSHILEQVEAVADRVGILVDGSLVAEGEVGALHDEFGLGDRLTIEVSGAPADLADRIEAIDGVEVLACGDGEVEVSVRDGQAKFRALSVAHEAGVYEDFVLESSTLDDVFSSATGGGS